MSQSTAVKNFYAKLKTWPEIICIKIVPINRSLPTIENVYDDDNANDDDSSVPPFKYVYFKLPIGIFYMKQLEELIWEAMPDRHLFNPPPQPISLPKKSIICVVHLCHV